MKIRAKFVSNSSSASFIVKFKSDKSRDEIATMIRKSNEWLDEYWDKTERETWDWFDGFNNKEKIKETITPKGETFLTQDGEIFSIHTDAAVMNDWTDLLAWQFIRGLHEGRIPFAELIENRKIFDEYTECDEVVKDFDKFCWEYDSYVISSLGKSSPEDIKQAYDRQHKVEMEYIDYLASIGINLSKEEQINLTKYLLSE